MLSSAGHNMTYKEGIRFDDLDASTGYTAFGAYGQSKLANLLFARHLAKHMPHPGQTTNAVHPGVIATNLGRHMPAFVNAAFRSVGPLFASKTVPQGAATPVFVATHPSVADVTGEYFSDCNTSDSSEFGRDADLAARLWDVTEAMVARLPS